MILLDGPMGTMLAARGVPTPPPLWSAAALDTHPEVIASLHGAYAAAGATVHTAVTFRTQPRFVAARAPALTRQAVSLARAAVPHHHRVAGSLAPLADCYRPDLSPADPSAEHAVMAALLADAGADLILAETFPHVGECVAATTAAVATGLPVWASLTPGPQGDLLTPAALAEGARRLAGVGAEVVLVNCLPAARALPWVRALARTGLVFGVYANAGRRDEGLWWDQPGSADRWFAHATQWRTEGAEVLGACCGSGILHVSSMKSLASP